MGNAQWIGIAILVIGIWLEAVADQQKSALKAKRATEQLYRIVRCPNYFGEILFWTGVTVSALDILQGAGQWITGIVAYALIVLAVFNGAQRLEKRQMVHYGQNAVYKSYMDHSHCHSASAGLSSEQKDIKNPLHCAVHTITGSTQEGIFFI